MSTLDVTPSAGGPNLSLARPGWLGGLSLLVLVGIPYAIAGGNTPKTDEVLAFKAALEAKITTPIMGWDERYSTDEAHQELKKMGYSWQEARGLVDAMAAAMILKSYLGSLL